MQTTSLILTQGTDHPFLSFENGPPTTWAGHTYSSLRNAVWARLLHTLGIEAHEPDTDRQTLGSPSLIVGKRGLLILDPPPPRRAGVRYTPDAVRRRVRAVHSHRPDASTWVFWPKDWDPREATWGYGTDHRGDGMRAGVFDWGDMLEQVEGGDVMDLRRALGY
jgi:hypothetical protein